MGFVINTDFSTIEPNTGGASYFPISDSKGWLCQITEADSKETTSKDGRRAVLTLTGLEGPVMGRTHTYGINTSNPNPEAVRIGMGELSAIAHVIGHLRVGRSEELLMKPFRVVIASDASEKYPDATKVTKVLDVNGNPPKSAGQGALNPAQSGVVGAGAAAGFGGQPQGNPQGGFAGNPQGQGGFGGGAVDPQAGQGFGGQPQGNPQGGFAGNPQGQGPQGMAQGAGGFGSGQQQQGGSFQQQQPNGGAPNWA